MLSSFLVVILLRQMAHFDSLSGVETVIKRETCRHFANGELTNSRGNSLSYSLPPLYKLQDGCTVGRKEIKWIDPCPPAPLNVGYLVAETPLTKLRF